MQVNYLRQSLRWRNEAIAVVVDLFSLVDWDLLGNRQALSE